MSKIAKTLRATFEDNSNNYIAHHGVGHLDGGHSGRYPWGSGEHPFQTSGDFLSRIQELKNEGMSSKQIADALGMTTTELRIQNNLAKYERNAELTATAKKLREQGMSLDQIAKTMGYENDSSVRWLLNEDSKARSTKAMRTAEFLKEMVDTSKHGMVDVGAGTEQIIGNLSREKLNEALYILEREGYNVIGGGVPNLTNPGKQTNLRVLCSPDIPYKIGINPMTGKETKVSSAIYDFDKIRYIGNENWMTQDRGETFRKSFEYPASMDSSRLIINYGDQGGKEKDGIIELRRGVKDLDLGAGTHYAQVRILVDNDKYLKGMAVYADDLPEGIDVRFNTNKSSGTPMNEVLKGIKKDKDNPFGSLIKEKGGQSYYDDPNGKYVDPITGNRQSLSLINKRAEEGDWESWSDSLPSQFLAKQPLQLINRQINLSLTDRKEELASIESVTNPTIKKKLLVSYAEDCDSMAEHLQAAALPNQKYQVILPLTTLTDKEIYAPRYKDGEQVALIRYPHGGTFEIPILTVNNKNKEGDRVLTKQVRDAVGINANVAARLSGADFDGDTVMVIPVNSRVKIQNSPPLEGLRGFETSQYNPDSSTPVKVDKNGNEYYSRNGHVYKRMLENHKQNEMGRVSNLITDMTLAGADSDELACAVRHSMVVIDAAKHCLDYKQSAIDNNIAYFKKKYQLHTNTKGKESTGAATILSRAKGEVDVIKKQGNPKIDETTGELIYNRPAKYFTDPKTGKERVRTEKSTQMRETNDAFTLVSDPNNLKEAAYAKYANELKTLANKARLESLSKDKIAYSKSAATLYSDELTSLNSKLALAKSNQPKERQAQGIANMRAQAKKKANPEMSKSEYKKIKQQELTAAREQVGARRQPIEITENEWKAIQSGAVSTNMLTQMLNYADIDVLREYATPRNNKELSVYQINRMKALRESGYTLSEIAEAIGVSTTTVSKKLKGE